MPPLKAPAHCAGSCAAATRTALGTTTIWPSSAPAAGLCQGAGRVLRAWASRPTRTQLTSLPKPPAHRGELRSLACRDVWPEVLQARADTATDPAHRGEMRSLACEHMRPEVLQARASTATELTCSLLDHSPSLLVPLCRSLSGKRTVAVPQLSRLRELQLTSTWLQADLNLKVPGCWQSAVSLGFTAKSHPADFLTKTSAGPRRQHASQCGATGWEGPLHSRPAPCAVLLGKPASRLESAFVAGTCSPLAAGASPGLSWCSVYRVALCDLNKSGAGD